MNNTELSFLIFVITFGIGIVTGYLLKYMPKKDESKEPVSCRYYKESDCWYFKTKCYGLHCNAYVTKEG
jgi:hypothetical protein